MITIPFTAEDIQQLHYERFHYPHPRVPVKMEALYLQALGYPHQDIANVLRLTETTVRSYFKDYAEGGIDALKRFNPHDATCASDSHLVTWKESFDKHPVATATEADQRIEVLTGQRRRPTQVRIFVKKTALNTVKPDKSRQKPTPSRRNPSSKNK